MVVKNGAYLLTKGEATILRLPTVEVEQGRYDDLIAKEERLKMLEHAIKQKGVYESINDIQNMFGLKKGNENE